MSDLELPDPESIPLPDDIPVPPDEIPLPPDEDNRDTKKLDDNSAELIEPANNKRHASDDDHVEILPTNHDSSQSNTNRPRKKLRNGHQETTTPSAYDDRLVIPDFLKREQELMATLMGFTNFDTTKGKMVPGNQAVGAVHVVKKRRYRQYMNRKGGFNRPLDKVP